MTRKLLPIIFFFSIIFLSTISAQNWQFHTVAEGVKPALDLETNGNPHISFMLEDHTGFVKHAVWDSTFSVFFVTTVATGYFYGPLDLALDQNNKPHISYHSHTFEDQVHSYLNTTTWINDRIQNPGHDGWDNCIVIDADNYPRTCTVDPSGFNGDGVEYAFFDGNTWQVEVIGSASIMYANGTSLAIDKQGTPHITYYNDITRQLKYAEKVGGNWQITTVDSAGDTGRFSSLQLDADDKSHITYYQHLGDSSGVVKYAVQQTNGWDISTIDTLYDVYLGFAGARNMTALVLNSSDMPQVSYSDEKIMKYAVWNGATWQKETVVDLSATPMILGQLTSLKLDRDSNPHVAYYEVTSKTPLKGIVKYATRNAVTAITEKPEINPQKFELYQNFPNPFNPSTTITYRVSTLSKIALKIFDILGNEVKTLVNGIQTPGIQTVNWDGKNSDGNDVGSGVFIYRLITAGQVISKKMILIR